MHSGKAVFLRPSLVVSNLSLLWRFLAPARKSYYIMARIDQRPFNTLRQVSFTTDFQRYPAGSVLATFGHTKVICAVSVEESVPRWMKEQQVAGGWITAEYQMLPAATNRRSSREVTRGKLSGRSAEIQRLIGRSLRAAVDLSKLPGLTLYVDCDVLDADGGTRCAAITGASVALQLATQKLLRQGVLVDDPIISQVAAVSVGMLHGEALLDLCQEEDSAAEVDMNVVMTKAGRLVEIQGSGEEATFTEEELQQMLSLAKLGLEQIFVLQDEVLAEV